MPLTRLDETIDYVPSFVAADIENLPDGEVFAVDTAWRNEAGDIEHFRCDDWDEWWPWLIKMARNDDKFRVIYAHNGGGWDWLSLCYYLLNRENERETITAICAGSAMVTMTVRIESRLTIHFCDSLQLLRSSLDKLGHTLLGRGKVDTGGKLPHEIYAIDRSKFEAYLRRDTETLLLVLERAIELLRENVAKIDGFGYTIGSTAMRVFRTIGLGDVELSVPEDETLKDFLRQGYRGGRVQVFRYGYHPHVKVYDINSLYPYAMVSEKVPVTDRVSWRPYYERGSVGLFRVNYHQRKTDVPPVLVTDNAMSGRENGVVEGSSDSDGLQYSGTGTFFAPELDYLLNIDPRAKIEVLEGATFLDTEYLFADYVNRLYTLRQTDKNGPVSLLCKFLLNSLYGKFGQKSEREKIVIVDDLVTLCELIDDGAKVRVIDEETGVHSITSDHPCDFEHVGIAGTITSAARVALHWGMVAAGKGLCYVDTDSVHIAGDFPSHLVGDGLGAWKLEFSGEGIYCGKKLYALRSETGEEKIRAKGVSVGGRLGAAISFNDFLRIADGGEFTATFYRPATPLQTVKGETPCKFTPKTRTLRMT